MKSSGYVGSPAWRDDVRNAKQKYREVFHCSYDHVAHVVAQAGTGSRYSVIVSTLSETSRIHEGGRFLVTVLAPWQNCWTWTTGEMDMAYVTEHLGNPNREVHHGGDIVALTMTINRALYLANMRGTN